MPYFKLYLNREITSTYSFFASDRFIGHVRVMPQSCFVFQSFGVAFGKGVFCLQSIALYLVLYFFSLRNITPNIEAIDCTQKIYLPITAGEEKNVKCSLAEIVPVADTQDHTSACQHIREAPGPS